MNTIKSIEKYQQRLKAYMKTSNKNRSVNPPPQPHDCGVDTNDKTAMAICDKVYGQIYRPVKG